MEKSNRLSGETRYELVLKIAQAIFSTERGRKELQVSIPTDDGFLYIKDKDFSNIGDSISMYDDDESFIKSYNDAADLLQEKYDINVPHIQMQVSVTFYCGANKIEA